MSEPQRLYSVTTLTKVGLGSGEGLLNWAANVTAEAAVQQHGLIGKFLEGGDKDGAIEHLRTARFRSSKKAMLRGSELHAAAEALALGAEPKIPEGGEAYVEQYRRFLERFQPRFLMAEAPVYNPSYGYAGTLDGIIELPALPGRQLLFDIKTTEHSPDSDRRRPPYEETALQLVAYARAEMVGVLSEQRYDGRSRRYYLYDPDVPHEAMPQVDGAIVLVLSPYDCTPIPVRVDDEIWEAFLDVIAMARFRLHTSKHLYGPPLQTEAVTV